VPCQHNRQLAGEKLSSLCQRRDCKVRTYFLKTFAWMLLTTTGPFRRLMRNRFTIKPDCFHSVFGTFHRVTTGAIRPGSVKTIPQEITSFGKAMTSGGNRISYVSSHAFSAEIFVQII
jgi:hypothetical protein